MGRRRRAAAILAILTICAAVLVIAATISSQTVSSSSSTVSSSSSISSLSSSAVYQIVASNLTLRGRAATVLCPIISEVAFMNCQPAGNASLSGVDLVKYGQAYYYSLQNQSAMTGFDCRAPGRCYNYTYGVWFTNSTVSCVSYRSVGQKASICPSLPTRRETITMPVPSESKLDVSDGLRFSLTVSTNSTGKINIMVTEQNTLNRSNNVTIGHGFPPSGHVADLRGNFFMWIGPCEPVSPVGYEILRGNYGENNYTEGTPFALTPGSPVQCGGVADSGGGGPSTVNFSPLGNNTQSGGWSGFWIGSVAASYGSSCSNVGTDLSPNPDCRLSFVPFPSGPYTVVAGDEWGRLVLLHFVIAG